MQIPSCVKSDSMQLWNTAQVQLCFTQKHVLESYWTAISLFAYLHDDMGDDIHSYGQVVTRWTIYPSSEPRSPGITKE